MTGPFTQLATALHGRGYFEPAMSTRDLSVREMYKGPRRIRHRFPFPGALTGMVELRDNIEQPNAMLAMLKARKSSK